MRNHTSLVGQKVILVPYRKRHVDKYHSWMKSDELRRLTASKPLSLMDEYRMQERWHEDDDKLTFIILSRDLIDSGADEISSMVGDINIYINGSVGELTVMIAEPAWRHKGLGREAVQAMMKYAYEVCKLRMFEVRISEDNIASLNLFRGLGFIIVSKNDIFHEFTLLFDVEKSLETFAQLEVTMKISDGAVR